MDINGNNMSMIRGDSASFEIEMVWEDGTPEDFQPGDIIYFTVKENIRRKEYALQKEVREFEENKANIVLDPQDTHNLRAKSDYVYDIQLSRKDGTVKTIVPPSNFNLIGDVTRE